MMKGHSIIEEELRQVREEIKRSRKKAQMEAHNEEKQGVPSKMRVSSQLRKSNGQKLPKELDAFRKMPIEELMAHEKGILNLID